MNKEAEELAGFVFAAFAAILLGAVVVLVSAAGVQFTWNMAMPEVFGLPRITLRNALGLVGLVVVVRSAVIPSVSRSER